MNYLSKIYCAIVQENTDQNLKKKYYIVESLFVAHLHYL